jgi:HB1, ASXL, restriction endonuclease HTH domain
MRARELWDLIESRGLFLSLGKTPWATIGAKLATETTIFEGVAPGRYRLRRTSRRAPKPPHVLAERGAGRGLGSGANTWSRNWTRSPKHPGSLCGQPVAPLGAAGDRIGGRGEIAQLVEHSTENRGVGGSSPPLATILTKVEPAQSLRGLGLRHSRRRRSCLSADRGANAKRPRHGD